MPCLYRIWTSQLGQVLKVQQEPENEMTIELVFFHKSMTDKCIEKSLDISNHNNDTHAYSGGTYQVVKIILC